MIRTLARVGRDFLGRGVSHLVGQGVTQFLDLGSGVPTVGNVHEVADSLNPGSRCVYVDCEPVAVAHSQTLLERDGDLTRHAVLHGDLRNPADIWARALDTGVLDPRQPIGLIMVGVLYFFSADDHPHEVVAAYRNLLPSGSYLLSSHVTQEGVPQEQSYILTVNFTWKDLRSGRILMERKNFQQAAAFYPTLREGAFVGSQEAVEKLALDIVQQMQAEW